MTRKARSKAPKKTEPATATPGGLCFVVMPYGEPFDSYYTEVYAPAVRGVGLEPVRADSLFRSSSILDDIWRLTREAKVLLADMSNSNPNVFYELGLAHAIAQPVVLVAPSIDDVPFDLRGLRVIIYNKDDAFWGKKLFESIQKALTETLKDLRSAVPPTFMESAPPTHAPKEDAVTLELRKLQDTIRALQASLPQTKKETPVTEVEISPAGQRLRKAFDYMFSRYRSISSYQAALVILPLQRGHRAKATKELRALTGLPPKEAASLLNELEAILQSPKDELLRTDRGEL